jgi:phosphoglycolate phosphatase-like HAD superfamily hydrolase
MSNVPDAARPLLDFKPAHPFFVGIDSDGCAFDNMELKQKECFIPNIIKFWNLQAVAKYAREVAEFVNLYSKWRGINRWPALIKDFDLLAQRPEVLARKAPIPQAPAVRRFIASGFALSNEGLQAYLNQHPETELERALAWSTAVNDSIEDIVHHVPPFPYVRASLERLAGVADTVVVSATPTPSLAREWEEHDLARYPAIIAGQEMGAKKQHLAWGAGGKYDPGHVLMLGDALGDLEAARANAALFFPIKPGHEDESWECFYSEALDRFVNESYAGAYETRLVAEFESLLPGTPPWNK